MLLRFLFFEPFRAGLASKFEISAHMIPEKNVSQKICVHIKKTEIDADFESVENFAKRVIQTKIECRELLYTIYKR
jgi:hypothetical protein